jgi:hypothetical protein
VFPVLGEYSCVVTKENVVPQEQSPSPIRQYKLAGVIEFQKSVNLHIKEVGSERNQNDEKLLLQGFVSSQQL